MNRTPIDLEALLNERKRAEEAASKPKFMSREERERLEIERREKEEEQQRVEQLEEQKRRRAFLEGKNSNGVTDSMETEDRHTLSQQDLQLIKERYMGGSHKSGKKLRRFGDRRSLFEWDESDDTSLNQQADVKANGYNKRNKSRFDVEKDVHWTKKTLAQMKDRDWRILKEDFNISTQGGQVPNPIRFWRESELNESIQSAIERIGYDEPTPIQRQAIPIAIKKRDLIGMAETGSGKTLAFLLPIFQYIMNLPRLNSENALDGPYALILAPTRELAQQIEKVAQKFASHLGYQCVAIVGGQSVAEQSMKLRRGAEIVIATPGRLKDCLEQHVLVLNQCYSVVLDEADRMIDLNFEEDLQFILKSLPSSNAKPDSELAEDPTFLSKHRFRQMTMFSATMPPSVERLAKLYLRKPAVVIVGEAGQVVDRIEQNIEIISDSEKPSRLISILEEFDAPVIIFVNQKTTVDMLYNRLTTLGFRAIALHGGKGQDQREAAISQLKVGTKDILIATDVASRGIDVKDVKLVLNYDMAKTIEDYVHRIGRTGRAGKEGHAITFLTDKDTDVYYDLRVMLQKSSKSSIPPEFMNHEASRNKPGTIQQKRRHEEQIFAYGV